MFIRFTCPNCQKILKVGDKFAGKTSKCPGCAAPVTVPEILDVLPADAPVELDDSPVAVQGAGGTPAASNPQDQFQFDTGDEPAPRRRAPSNVSAGLLNMLIGGTIGVVGLVVTIYSLVAAMDKGGGYVVAYGAIIFGAIQFFRGFIQLLGG